MTTYKAKGIKSAVWGDLVFFVRLVLILFFQSCPIFLQKKNGTQKEPRGRDWLAYRPALVFAREPSAIPSSCGVWGPEGLLGFGLAFLRWWFCCGGRVCRWDVLRWMWFSFYRLGDWPAFWAGFYPSILICGDRMGGAGRRVSGNWMGASPLRGIGPVAVSLKKASFEPAPNGLVRRTLSRRME